MDRKLLLLIASIFVIVPTFAEGEISGSLDNNGTLAIFDPEGDGSGDTEGNGTGFSDAQLGGLIAGVAAGGGMLAYGAFKKRAKIKSLLVAGKDAVVSGVTATGGGIAFGIRATGQGIVAGARGTLRFTAAPFKMAAEASSRTYAATKEKLSTWNENRQIKNIASMEADIAKQQARVDALRQKAQQRAAAKTGQTPTRAEEKTAAAVKIQSIVRMKQAQKQAQILRAALSRPSLPPSAFPVGADASADSLPATPPKTRTPLSTSLNSKMLAAVRLTPQSRADVPAATAGDDAPAPAASGVGGRLLRPPLVATIKADEPDSPRAAEGPTPEQLTQRKAEADAAVAQAKLRRLGDDAPDGEDVVPAGDDATAKAKGKPLPRKLGARALAVAKLQPKPKADPDVVQETAPDGILSGSRPSAVLSVVKDDAPEPTDTRSVASVDGVDGPAEDDSGDGMKPPVKRPVRIEVEASPEEIAAADKKKAAVAAKLQSRRAAVTSPTGAAEAPDEDPAVKANTQAQLAATRAAQAEKRKAQKAAEAAVRKAKGSALAGQYAAERKALEAAAETTEELTATDVPKPDDDADEKARAAARSNATAGPDTLAAPAPIPVTAPLERVDTAREDDAASPSRTVPSPAPAQLKPLSVAPPPAPAASRSPQRTATEPAAVSAPSPALARLQIPDDSAAEPLAASSVAAVPAASPAVDDRTAAFKQRGASKDAVAGSAAASSPAIRSAFADTAKRMPEVKAPASARSAESLYSQSASFIKKGVEHTSTVTQRAYDDPGTVSPRLVTSKKVVEGKKRAEAKTPLSARSVSSASIASSSPRISGSATARSPRSGESPGNLSPTASSLAKQAKPAPKKPQPLRRTQSAKMGG